MLAIGSRRAAGDDDAARAKARLAFMKKSAADYRFEMRGARDNHVALSAEPILRWNNEVVKEEDAALFLWHNGKRPVCAAQFFLQHGLWHHEFQSLTDQPFEVKWAGPTVWHWTATRPGVRFAPADLDLPAEKAPARLRQMRKFAEGFTAAVDPSRSGKFDDPHQLRLLPTPVYRYAAETEQILDGAIFAFAQGTNPEVLLLLEAIRNKDGNRFWQHAFAPMTSFEARVQQGDKIVWQQDMLKVPTTDPKDSYQFRWAVLREDGNQSAATAAPEGGVRRSSK